MDTAKPSKEVRIARVILRAILREPGITRTHLSVQVRPYGAEWTDVLEHLKTQGLIQESAVIVNPTGKHKRAAIAYQPSAATRHLDYETLSPETVARFANLPLLSPTTAIATSSAA
jgi:hypothetical protein